MSEVANDTLRLGRTLDAGGQLPSAKEVLDTAEMRVKALFEGLKQDILASKVSADAGGAAGDHQTDAFSAAGAHKAMGM